MQYKAHRPNPRRPVSRPLYNVFNFCSSKAYSERDFVHGVCGKQKYEDKPICILVASKKMQTAVLMLRGII